MICSKASLLATTMIAGLSFAVPAFAQSTPPASTAEVGITAQTTTPEPDDDGEVVVTGTRITNPNLEQSSPVTVIGEGEIALQQVTSAEELLHELPGHIPSLNQNVNNGGTGAAFVNLRGLGSNRNLVLLDGARIVPVDLVARTDLNQIPTALIERVDVFTGGASTVYGADAVAGVVNFITKRDFAGVEFDLGAGVSDRGDGHLLRGSATFGANFADGRGNAVLSLGYAETDDIYYRNRLFSNIATSSATGLPQGSDTAVPLSIRNGGAAFTQLNTSSNLLVPRFSTFNTNPLNLLQTPLQRFNMFSKARFEISDAVELYATGMYTKSEVVFNAAPTGIFANNVFVPVSNPFLPVSLRNQLCGLVDSNPTLAGTQTLTQAQCDAAAVATTTTNPAYRELLLTADRRFAEAGPRVTTYNFNTFQFTGGARGALTSSLNWNLWGGYGELSRVTSATSGLLANVQQALRSTNSTTCTVATGGCVPLNIFGAEGSITPQMLNYLAATTYTFVDTKLTQGQATVEGDFGYVLPWATQPVGVSAGLEYRKYFGFSRGDAISSVPGAVLGAGAAALPQQGSYNSKEAFAEMIVPIIEDRPFIDNLTLEVGGRYADYNLSGGNWTYKVGGSYSPVPDLKIRGMFTKAVRAPNLAELFQPQVVALSNLTTDPCQGQITNSAPGTNYNATLAGSAALRALCVATGVPANVIGTGAIPAPSSGQIQTTQGGNTDLGPEVAKTFTFGAVFQPSFIPNFALTVDYYNINIKRAITSPTVNDVVQGCYGAGNPNFAADNLFCGLVIRNSSTGRLDGEATTTPGLQLALSNQGFLQTRGIDVTANYRHDLGFARIAFALNANHTLRARFKAIPSPLSPLRDCTGYYSASCQPIQPKTSWSLRTTLSWLRILDTSLLWRHTSSAKLEPNQCTTDDTLSCGPNPATIFDAYEKVDAYNYFDLSNRLQVTDTISAVFTVMNLLDKQPPFVGNTVGSTAFNHGNTFPSNYDPVGRQYRVGLNVRF